ncbi:MAG: histidine--tRNA ligase [Bacteroidales bacterium]|nr:histidine--tRNA ligase [Bacteroidales bacterium]
MQKPSIPKGTRDFSPFEMIRRNYIFDTIIRVFELFGYQPIETPAMENLSSLMGKSGEEGDRLLYKVLNSGNFLSSVDENELQERNINNLSTKICVKGLRFDLTVPFARYVVQHRNDITFPFKRYQVQAVWRADRPQKGRYREFYQCDVDVIGSDSLLNEVELIQIAEKVFSDLGIEVIIKINNRKILSGIAEIIGEPEKLTEITVAIDKLEKIGLENVNAELLSKGIDLETIESLQSIILLSGTNSEKLHKIKEILHSSPIGLKGIEEIEFVLDKISKLDTKASINFDLTLARGLSYYTGAIIEVKAKNISFGSICGGGRYDDLTGIFGLPDVSGVGISFGADRIYDVLLEENLFPADVQSTTTVMFANFGEKEEAYCLPLVSQFRKSGINTELYPDQAKLKKQMIYANKKNIPYVILTGEEEVNSNTMTIKNMNTGEQNRISVLELDADAIQEMFGV